MTIGAVIIGVMTLGSFYWINELYRSAISTTNRPRFERASSWGLAWVGAWQWSIAAFSGLFSSWVAAIPLFGAGAFLMFSGWFQWRTRAWRASR